MRFLKSCALYLVWLFDYIFSLPIFCLQNGWPVNKLSLDYYMYENHKRHLWILICFLSFFYLINKNRINRTDNMIHHSHANSIPCCLLSIFPRNKIFSPSLSLFLHLGISNYKLKYIIKYLFCKFNKKAIRQETHRSCVSDRVFIKQSSDEK